MDFETAFKKPFGDIKNLLIGILLSILPIVNFFAKGYILQCSGVGKNKTNKMPGWKNYGDLFVMGFASWVIGIVYMVPALIIVLIGAAAILISLIKVYIGNIIPISMLKDMAAGVANEEALKAIIQQNWYKAVPYLISLAPIIIFAIILALIAAYIIPIAVLNYVRSNKFGDAFNFGNVFKKAFTGQYFLTWIVVIVISAVIGAILHWIPLIGRAASFFIGGVIGYTLFGEVYKKV